MTSAVVNTFDCKNNQIKTRILLDTCASANFVTNNLVEKLKLKKKKCCIAIGALNDLSTTVNSIVTITFQSLYNDYKRSLNFLVVPKIIDLIPAYPISREKIKIPPKIQLADPNFHKPAPIDMLIGSGTTLSLFCIGSINMSKENHDFYLQKTRLGWIFGGGLDYSNEPKSKKRGNCLLSDLDEALERFWNIEEIVEETHYTQEELECEKHFKKHVSRDKDGRYIVALPFKKHMQPLGETKTTALKRLHYLNNKFSKNEEYKIEYTKVMENYLKSNFMSPSKSEEHSGYY